MSNDGRHSPWGDKMDSPSSCSQGKNGRWRWTAGWLWEKNHGVKQDRNVLKKLMVCDVTWL